MQCSVFAVYSYTAVQYIYSIILYSSAVEMAVKIANAAARKCFSSQFILLRQSFSGNFFR